MKKLFFFAAAALALASCSSDETTAVNQSQNDGNEISFRPLVNNVTRASDILASTLQSDGGFTVFANVASTDNEYFPETVFAWDGTSSSYRSVNKYYWPSSGSLDFFAYAPNTSTQFTHTAREKAFTVTPTALSSATSASSQVDLVFANTNGKSKGSSENDATYYGKNGVVLNFRHAESKVAICIKNTNPNLIFTVGDVKIGNLYTSGTYTYNDSDTDGENNATLTSSWGYGLATQTGNYSFAMSSTASYNVFSGASGPSYVPNSTAADYEMILIPQTLTTSNQYASNSADATYNAPFISVELAIQNKSNDAYIIGGVSTKVEALWPLPTVTWAPGKKYIYTVDLAGGGYYTTNKDDNADLDPILENTEIKFVNVTVDAWSDGGNTDVAGPTL